jgi:hypothetical protein
LERNDIDDSDDLNARMRIHNFAGRLVIRSGPLSRRLEIDFLLLPFFALENRGGNGCWGQPCASVAVRIDW